MTSLDWLLTGAASLVIGALIGSIGVGGVLLAPWLTQGVGLPVHQALGITMLALAAPGALALLRARNASSGPSSAQWRLVLASLPGALAGTLMLAWLPPAGVVLLLAAAVGFVGLRLLTGSGSPAVARHAAHRAPGAPTGLLTGFASALTGTGGPMVLTPWLLWRGRPLPEAVMLGQLVQLPIAGTASLTNLLTVGVDTVPGLVIGAILVPGALLGYRLAPRLPQRRMGQAVGGVLVMAAIALIVRRG